MNRSDKEIKNTQMISDILHRSTVCHLGLARNDEPYIVPVSFGYDGKWIYFHTARKGKKLDFIARNNRVCFECEVDVALVSNGDPCNWSFSFQSVIGLGTIHELIDADEKEKGLGHIIRHYDDGEYDLSDKRFSNLRVWKIQITEMTGKRSAIQ